jgi:hypothetical protein
VNNACGATAPERSRRETGLRTPNALVSGIRYQVSGIRYQEDTADPTHPTYPTYPTDQTHPTYATHQTYLTHQTYQTYRYSLTIVVPALSGSTRKPLIEGIVANRA